MFYKLTLNEIVLRPLTGERDITGPTGRSGDIPVAGDIDEFRDDVVTSRGGVDATI